MDSKYPALEWAVIVLSLGMFVFYHGWFAAKPGACYELVLCHLWRAILPGVYVN